MRSKKLTQKTTELRASRYDMQLCKESMITREIKRFACLEELKEGKHGWRKSLIRWSIEKICSVQSS